MIVPDVNLLIYATDDSSVHHAAASRWWDSALNSTEPIGLPWSTVLAFLRLTTNPRVFVNPLTTEQAVDVVRGWLASPPVLTLEPASGHLDVVASLLTDVGSAGNLVIDAHLAALAIEHGATLCSADADFGRFSGLRWANPLAD